VLVHPQHVPHCHCGEGTNGRRTLVMLITNSRWQTGDKGNVSHMYVHMNLWLQELSSNETEIEQETE